MKINFAIAGAGIVGLFTGLALKKKFPDAEIAIFEKEPYLADHTTGRNSGVLHAGIYYPNNSLKHLLCIEGNLMWEKIASDLNLQIKRCGKFIFSQSPFEDSELQALLEKALKNNVPQIREATTQELAEVKKVTNAHHALFSPFTGILDVSSTMSSLEAECEKNGIYILKKSEIKNLSSRENEFVFEVNGDVISSDYFINTAGLWAIHLREQLGLGGINNYFVKGNYLSTTQKLDYQYLYYPVPPKDLKGLGVHSTIDLAGKIKFGPNTEDTNEINYAQTQEMSSEIQESILKTFKNIDREKLFWDYAGIRPKIKDSTSGKQITDFLIHSPMKNYIECLGIESPGVTASPAISNYILKYFI